MPPDGAEVYREGAMTLVKRIAPPGEGCGTDR